LASGWSYDEVLHFFKISEDNRDLAFASDGFHHSVGGPQPVSRPKFITPLGTAFLVRKRFDICSNFLFSFLMLWSAATHL
jgi:choline dehydrogenase-like flavoprotein